MWLFTQYGFYDAATHSAPGDEDEIYAVRSHAHNDLENLKALARLDNEILETSGEVRWRLELTGEEWSRALASLGASIDYANLSERIQELPDQRGKLAALREMERLLHAVPEPSPEEIAHEANRARPEGMSIEEAELEAMYEEAVTRGQDGDHAGALEIVEQIILRAPEIPVGHWMKGVNLMALGQNEAAVWALQEGLELDPHDQHALWNMGLACTRTGRNEAAVVALKHALELDPDYLDALYLLGHVFARENDIETPQSLDEWLAQFEPGDEDESAAGYFLQTLAYLALDDIESAREAWEDLSDIDFELASRLEPWLESEAHALPPGDWEELNDDLRGALDRAARFDARGDNVPLEATEMVYRAFMDSWLLVPLNAEPVEGETGGASLSLRSGILEGIGNKTGLVAFTDEAAARAFFGELPEHNVVLSGGDLCRALAQMAGHWTDSGAAPAALIVNPSGPHPYVLSLTRLVFLATGGVPLDEEHAVIGEGTRVEIRRANADETPPAKLLEVARDAVATHAVAAGAKEVWWFILRVGEGEPHLGFGVFPGDRQTLDTIGRAINDVWWEHATVMAVFDVLGMEGDLEIRIRKGGERLWAAD